MISRERAAGGQRALHGGEQALDLAVDDDGVEALLAAEVLVDDRLADAGRGGDLLDRGPLEALVGEVLATDADELLAPLAARHPGSRGAGGLVGRRVAHHAIVPA